MKKKSTPVLFLALIFLFASCSHPASEADGSPSPALNSSGSADFYGQIPGDPGNVYYMHVVWTADGSATASRSIIPAGPSTVTLGLILPDSYTPAGSSLSGTYSQDYWFIPFDPGQSATVVAGGGTVTVTCDCRMSGGCEASTTITTSGVTTKCTPYTCTGSCKSTTTLNGSLGSVSELSDVNGVCIAASNLAY